MAALISATVHRAQVLPRAGLRVGDRHLLSHNGRLPAAIRPAVRSLEPSIDLLLHYSPVRSRYRAHRRFYFGEDSHCRHGIKVSALAASTCWSRGFDINVCDL